MKMSLLCSCAVLCAIFAVCESQDESSAISVEERNQQVLDDYLSQLQQDMDTLWGDIVDEGKKECVAGYEEFQFCSLDQNIVDFFWCLFQPVFSIGQDMQTMTRNIVFEEGTFLKTPAVAIGISGIGQLAFSSTQVQASPISQDGFTISVSAGFPALPYSVTVRWVACPTKTPRRNVLSDNRPELYAPEPPRDPANPAFDETLPS